MARKLDASVTQTMELEDYEAFVQDNVDFGDFDCLCETAWALKALANNRKFLAQAANLKLRDYLEGKPGGALELTAKIKGMLDALNARGEEDRQSLEEALLLVGEPR